MRLVHLKLAGFKSFVDPTTLHLHGNRVGIVGPNGCGKSNIMEAVRWVLGESSAREMRGELMQDVIFNGSSDRKPVSRASVELHFDNSQGRAGGEWSQYAEIAVRRVLERDSGSAYFINNTQVRRRDVADLFLGTGLGSHAYAIIGQNTISRIIESKPEELRVFLEEAAGISKYKERRRETEARLRDTRENLARVADIRAELEKQIARLQSQAEVAAQYHGLQQLLKTAQGQLWLLRKRAAAADWEKAKRQVERLANELEAQTAQLRKTESGAEQLRQAHYASTEAVQQAQGRYYEANAGVTTLEQQIRHEQEKRDRLAAQLTQIIIQQDKLGAQLQARQAELAALVTSREALLAGETAMRGDLEARRAALLPAEQARQAALAQYTAATTAQTQTEQALQLETVHLQHARRAQGEVQQRGQKLAEEASRLAFPEAGEVERKQAELGQAEGRIGALDAEIADMQRREQESDAELQRCRQAAQEHAGQLAQMKVQRMMLEKIQLSLNQESRLNAWLKQQGLDGKPRFWECLKVAEGWETAVESVLGIRINALMTEDMFSTAGAARPPVSAVFCEGGASPAVSVGSHGRKPLRSCLELVGLPFGAVLDDWFAGIYVLEDGADAAAARTGLNPGEMLVSRAGDIYTRHSMSLYAPQSALHGVLERQRELAAIERGLPQAEAEQQRLQGSLEAAEQRWQELRRWLADRRVEQRREAEAASTVQLELQGLRQRRQHGVERLRQIELEQQQIAAQIQEFESQAAQGETALQKLQRGLAEAGAECERLRQNDQAGEKALSDARHALAEAERKVQQAKFDVEILSNKINELNNYIDNLGENITALAAQRGEHEAALTAETGEAFKSALETALEAKHRCEGELAAARDRMNEVEQTLQGEERSRMQIEHLLQPLRSRLEQGRLQEQQVRLNFEHCRSELAAAGCDESTLEQSLPAGCKPAMLEQQLAETEAQIAALGPVNLAAMQELEGERERDAYLESQAHDLVEAVQTLEDAIHRIDRETRGRLQQTFDEANRQFGELFKALFGGGQARLELQGEEILDTGVLVFAQPPGKKNTTIHLLSGGEKALTAIALVFALFRLNPAPFCLMDEVDAPLDDSNTERFCDMVRKMSEQTQFLFVTHNKITMEAAQQLIGVTMHESGVSRVVEVDIDAALQMSIEQESQHGL